MTVAGLLLLAPSTWFLISDSVATARASVYATPVDHVLQLTAGRHSVSQKVRARHVGEDIVIDPDQAVLFPDAITVTGPDGQAVPVSGVGGTTIESQFDGTTYLEVATVIVPDDGAYRLRVVSDEPAEVIFRRSPIGVGRLILGALVGGMSLIFGIVLWLMTLTGKQLRRVAEVARRRGGATVDEADGATSRDIIVTRERANPELGRFVETGMLRTNYHDVGEGPPVLLLHGSGPGVSAFANWRLTFQHLSPHFRLLAPDLAGFGFTQVPDGVEYTRRTWLDQVVAFLDAVGVERVSLIGNSFGGSMALALAISHPDRVDRIVLMGSAGVPFELTAGLDAVWGYQPSPQAMRSLMRDTFAYNGSLVTDELVQMRYDASVRPGVQEAFSQMFPAPRQRWVDALAHPESTVRGISHPTLLVHGRDDKVIPLETTMTLHRWIDDSQVHIFGRCGHWTQIEHAEAFCRLVADFLGRKGSAGGGTSL